MTIRVSAASSVSVLALALAIFGFGPEPALQGQAIGQIPGNGPPPPSWTPGAVDVTSDKLEVLPVQGQIHMVAGAGGNIVVQAGEDGLLVVDTGRREMSAQVLALLQRRFNKPIRFVINTSADADHIGGNASVAGAGRAQNVARGGRADLRA
jgi:beta-lactamase superfamily II metal-dependent hydrolase